MTRLEKDSFGHIEVAEDRLWGAQTQRSIGNFRIGWEKQPKPVIRALGVVKRAAAEANMALGRLDPNIGQAIAAAAQEVIDGKLDDHFPLVVFQTSRVLIGYSRMIESNRRAICSSLQTKGRWMFGSQNPPPSASSPP